MGRHIQEMERKKAWSASQGHEDDSGLYEH